MKLSHDETVLWWNCPVMKLSCNETVPGQNQIVSLRDSFITWQFHYGTVSLRDSFIMGQFHHGTVSLRDSFITRQFHHGTVSLRDSFIIGKRYSEAVVFEDFLKDWIFFTRKVHDSVHQLSQRNETVPWWNCPMMKLSRNETVPWWNCLVMLAIDHFLLFLNLNLKQLYLFLVVLYRHKISG
jgi:hypothetical protein